MIKSARRVFTLPVVPVQVVYSAVVLLGFAVLVLGDRVHPAVIYFLELYLSL